MKYQTYGCRERPGGLITVTVPDDIEPPYQLTVRVPDENYDEYTYWWHIGEDGEDNR